MAKTPTELESSGQEYSAQPAAEAPAKTLQQARAGFVAAVNRDTAGGDRERLLSVLDAFIKWSTSRPRQLRFCTSDTRAGVLSFERVDTGDVLWSATPVRGDAPYLSLIPRSSRRLAPEERARIVEVLNALTRTAMANETHLRISFGALKNDASRTSVLQLLEELLPVAKT
jgi:hypothetical protein